MLDNVDMHVNILHLTILSGMMWDVTFGWSHDICAVPVAACRVVEIDAIFTNAIGGSGAHAVAPECDGETKSLPYGNQTWQWKKKPIKWFSH